MIDDIHGAAAAPTRPSLDLVIDTNVVLDWLVFRDPDAAPVRDAVTSGRCRWICTGAMRDEFAHVIGRPSLSRWVLDPAALLAAFDAHAVRLDTPPPLGTAERLPCSDPDDQMFIDLAVAWRAHALLTRDRAVLRLASRSRRFGVLIATPGTWVPGGGRSPGADAATARLSRA